MKNVISLGVFLFICNVSFAQQKEAAEKLVDEGIPYHDKGDYEGAIAKYNKALELDKDNLLALSEKAFSLVSLGKYEESIVYCQTAIQKHPAENALATVYVTYGNALDALKKTDQSIEIYDKGIKLFSDYYNLHFNKGITLASVKKYEEAILSFQQSALLNPEHASSHNAIARLLNRQDKRIPALLAYSRFLVLEPQSERAKENLMNLQKIVKGNAEQTGEKSITININANMLGDTTLSGKRTADNFTSTDLLLALSAAQDSEKENKKKTAVEQFIRKFETVCASLAELKKDNYGFYWDYYVPYFTAMKDKKLVETFAHLAFASSDDPEVSKWLKHIKKK